MSQEALAFEAGVERNYISLLELGRNSPSARIIFKLCQALGTTPSRFIQKVEERMAARQQDNPINPW
jgi:transcriptional regulator with XRE-family HTH domain